MKKIAKFWIPLFSFLVILIILTPGCLNGNDDDDGLDLPEDLESTALIDANNQFNFELYKELVKGRDGENAFISSWSIFTALSMAYEGARGETSKEMETVLHLPTDANGRYNDFYVLQNHINDPTNGYQLSTANAFWGQKGYPFEQNYIDVLEDYYLAEADELDFAGDPEGAADEINEWVEDETNDKIKDLVSPNELGPGTRLVLTNAIYFKGNWKHSFNPDATRDKSFTLHSGTHTQVLMMNMDDEDLKFKFAQTDGLKILEFPYTDNELSMFFIMPDEYNGLPELESGLYIERFNELKGEMHSTNVKIFLPRFTFTSRYELEPVLSNLGIQAAFDPQNADFSGINDDEQLSISKVIHQSFVEVNEEGTEAAAATTIYTIGVSVPPPEPEFIADHPFLFLIRDNDTGNILFCGRVMDPSA